MAPDLTSDGLEIEGSVGKEPVFKENLSFMAAHLVQKPAARHADGKQGSLHLCCGQGFPRQQSCFHQIQRFQNVVERRRALAEHLARVGRPRQTVGVVDHSQNLSM